MEWCEDSIPVAINVAKSLKSIFAVYIFGNDEVSNEMTEIWNREAVVKKISSNKIISLKIEANSVSGKQFSQIYPVICVPCSYFIGYNGTPLEVVGGKLSEEEFIAKINSALQLLKDIPDQGTPTTASQEISHPSTSGVTGSEETTSTPHNSEEKKTQEHPPESKEEAQKEQSVERDSRSTVASSKKLEEKIDRAKELMIKKRREKTEKNLEKMKEQETERRELGKEKAKLKMWQEEQNAKELVEQRRKDKELDRIAKQRVREQIAQDRAERAARFQKHKDTEIASKKQKLEEKEQAEIQAATQQTKINSEFARIQFRLPNGSSVTEIFSSGQLFEVVYNFIAQHERNIWKRFSLTTRYPKKVFNSEDMNKTLLELKLTPSSIIILLPPSAANPSLQVSNDGGGLFSLLWFLLTPITAAWSYFTSFFTGTTPQPPPMTSASRPTEGQASTAASSGGARKKQGSLWQLKKDDDDNATWNGNSTQQM